MKRIEIRANDGKVSVLKEPVPMTGETVEPMATFRQASDVTYQYTAHRNKPKRKPIQVHVTVTKEKAEAQQQNKSQGCCTIL